MEPLLQFIYDLPLSQTIRESGSLFPWIESVHVVAVTLVVGAIAVVDLRLLGWVWTRRTVSGLTHEVLPVTWVAFALAAVTGLLMFVSNATGYGKNLFFLAKMSLLVVAFLNMMLFHFVTMRGMDKWNAEPTPPREVRLAGGASLALWVAIIACGRWIGFTLQ